MHVGISREKAEALEDIQGRARKIALPHIDYNPAKKDSLHQSGQLYNLNEGMFSLPRSLDLLGSIKRKDKK